MKQLTLRDYFRQRHEETTTTQSFEAFLATHTQMPVLINNELHQVYADVIIQKDGITLASCNDGTHRQTLCYRDYEAKQFVPFDSIYEGRITSPEFQDIMVTPSPQQKPFQAQGSIILPDVFGKLTRFYRVGEGDWMLAEWDDSMQSWQQLSD